MLFTLKNQDSKNNTQGDNCCSIQPKGKQDGWFLLL